jgi:hypothetical protein
MFGLMDDDIGKIYPSGDLPTVTRCGRFAVRGYISDAKGVIVEQNKSGAPYNPDVHLQKIAAQVTYYFNNKKYSYRSANFQNELQLKSAGSF